MEGMKLLFIIPIVMGFVVLAALCFMVFSMKFIKSYQNKHEPVYIKDKNGKLKKNAIAARFYKIIITNAITQLCLADSNNIGLWMLLNRYLMGEMECKPKTIENIHKELLSVAKKRFTIEQYESVKHMFKEIESHVKANLNQSDVYSKAYICGPVYGLWSSNVIKKMGRN